jgi:tetratricopeptide (TPR) repeat protein
VSQRNLGLAYAELGQFEKAWPLLRASVQKGQKDPKLYTRIAGLLDADGHSDQAEVYYRESLRMDADQMDAVLGLARVLERKGQKQQAEAFQAKARKMCPRQVAGFK